MKEKILLSLLALLLPLLLSSQEEVVARKNRWVTGWFHNQDQMINGVSFGLYSGVKSDRNTISNGVRLELFGLGILNFFVGGDVDFKIDFYRKYELKFSEKVNGLSLSTFGVGSNVIVNGLSINGIGSDLNTVNGFLYSSLTSNADKLNGIVVSGFGNYILDMNGIALTSLMNRIHSGNGLQLSVFSNKSRNFNGLQISLYNRAKTGRLVQLGLINYIKENPKGLRILPFINMRFRSRSK